MLTIHHDKEWLSRRTRNAQTGVDEWQEVPQSMTYAEWYKKHVTGEMEAAHKSTVNRTADSAQFNRYKSVLGNSAPKDLAAFQKMKYTEPTKWAGLKHDYNIVNMYEVDGKADVPTILRLHDAAFETKRNGFSLRGVHGDERKLIKDLKKGGNAAAMELDGVTYFSHSKFGTHGTLEVNQYAGKYPAVPLSENRRFQVIPAYEGDTVPRQFDTEAKFLEFVAAQKQPTDAFSVTILSEKHICPSCQGVVQQFKEAFPCATVNVISGKRGYNGDKDGLKTWKYING